MAEIPKFTLKDVKPWLDRETRSLFVPIHSRAQKLLDGMRKTLENLLEVSKALLENSGKEIEKRNMKIYGRARALNKLAKIFVDRLKAIKVPENVTYDSFQAFVEETRKAFSVTDVDVRNWFPRISPFFILDRRRFLAVFEKAKEQHRELESFLLREYVKTKTLEDTYQLIGKLNDLEHQLAEMKDQKARIGDELAVAANEKSAISQNMTDLKSKGHMSQLNSANSEIEVLTSEVRQRLQHLQKPFVKLQSLATHGEGSGLTPEELDGLNSYIGNPFSAFATEESGYPLLKHILVKLNVAMSADKLKLKPEKTRKAQQILNQILDTDSLAELHRKCVTLVSRRNVLAASVEVAETETTLSDLADRLDSVERRMKILDGERNTTERNVNETIEKIRSNKSHVEKNVLDFLGKRILVE